MMGVAAQDFRDGAATGAAQLAERLISLRSMGITPSDRQLQLMVDQIKSEWGGSDVLPVESD